jgi:hypothetical protein
VFATAIHIHHYLIFAGKETITTITAECHKGLQSVKPQPHYDMTTITAIKSFIKHTPGIIIEMIPLFQKEINFTTLLFFNIQKITKPRKRIKVRYYYTCQHCNKEIDKSFFVKYLQ